MGSGYFMKIQSVPMNTTSTLTIECGGEDTELTPIKALSVHIRSPTDAQDTHTHEIVWK